MVTRSKLVTRSSLLALWACCALPLIMSSTAAETATTAAMPGVGGGVPAPTTEVPSATSTTAASPPSNVAADTTSKKIPVEGGAGPHEEYVPAAEVASALPVPIPDGNPVEGAFTNGGLGGNQAFFPGTSGYGTAAGLGGFGPYGGGPGGLGPGTYGYNGPLYFGSAPTRSGLPVGSCAAVLLLLSAAMYI